MSLGWTRRILIESRSHFHRIEPNSNLLTSIIPLPLPFDPDRQLVNQRQQQQPNLHTQPNQTTSPTQLSPSRSTFHFESWLVLSKLLESPPVVRLRVSNWQPRPHANLHQLPVVSRSHTVIVQVPSHSERSASTKSRPISC